MLINSYEYFGNEDTFANLHRHMYLNQYGMVVVSDYSLYRNENATHMQYYASTFIQYALPVLVIIA